MENTIIVIAITALLLLVTLLFFLNKKLKREIEKKRELILNLESNLREKESLLKEREKSSEDKINFLNQTNSNIKEVFENLANKILEEKTNKFDRESTEKIDKVLLPVKENIESFRKRVDEVYNKDTEGRTNILNELKNLKDLNEKISKEANDLTNALKRDSKKRGNWGELVLERVLEISGLREGLEYNRQLSLKNEAGKSYQPDVVVNLPNKRYAIIDSKVSLVPYENYYLSEDKENQNEKLKDYFKAVKKHIEELSSKRYEDLPDIAGLGFVFMFIPIESAFSLLLDENSIFDFAFKNNIALVSPSTLLPILKTINNLWDLDKQNKNALKIANEAGLLYDKFVGFIQSFDEVGTYISKAEKSYSDTKKKISEGRGNLISKVESLKKLGVQSKKEIPQKFIEDFE